MIKSYHCIVEGKVQGGNFQSWTLENAQDLGLTGWVRFIGDGRGEILLQGDTDKYLTFRDLLGAEAPILDKKRIDWEIIDYDKVHDTFEMRG